MKAWDSVRGWVERRPKQAVLVAAVVAVLIGGQIGFVIGYKVEHDRTSSDVAKLKKAAAAGSTKTTPTTKPKAKTPAAARRDGTVTAVKPGSITIKTKAGTEATITMSVLTKVDSAAKGASSDVATGRHVLVKPPGAEVLVLREGTNLGRIVKSVSSTKVVLQPGNGLPAATAKVDDATLYETVTPAKATDIKVGDHIIAMGSAAKTGPLTAAQVIIVPATSKFAA